MIPNALEQTRSKDGSDTETRRASISLPSDAAELRTTPWPLLLFVCLISMLVNGHHLYRANQAIEFPYTHFLQDPSLYPNDPLVATVRYHATLFWHGVAIATHVIPLEWFMLGVFVLERLLAMYAISRMSRALAPGSRLAELGALLVVAFIPDPFIGSGTTLPDYTEQSALAISMLLLACAFLIEGKYWKWAICTGLAINLNVLYVLDFLTYSVAIFLADNRPPRGRLAAMFSLPLVFVCGLPVLIFVLRMPHQQMPNPTLWFDAMFARSALHLLPLTWPKAGYAEYGSLVAATVIVGCLYLRRNSALATFALAVTLVNALWLGLAFVAAYLVQSRLLLQIQPGRGTDIWYFFAGFVVACFIAGVLSRHFGDGTRSAICMIALFIPLAWGPSHMRQGSVPFLVTFLSLGLYVCSDRQNKTILYRTIAVALALSVAGAGLIKQARSAQPVRLFGTPLSAPDYEVFQAARFAGEHTATDAVFVVDPVDRSLEPFRGFARRSVFVEYKDGTAFFYDLSYVTTWCDRMTAAGCDAGINRKATAKPYATWTDTDIARLASNYKIDYWIVPIKHASTLKTLWTGRYWKILELRSPTTVPTPTPTIE